MCAKIKHKIKTEGVLFFSSFLKIIPKSFINQIFNEYLKKFKIFSEVGTQLAIIEGALHN